MKYVVIIICCIWLLAGCNQKIVMYRVSDISQIQNYESGPYTRHCQDVLNYIPDSHFYTQYIRINVHFMDDSAGDKSFSLEDGKTFMKQVIHNANERLNLNFKMNLPKGNTTPALNPRYEYKVTPAYNDGKDDGFYKHLDNDHFYFLSKGRHRNNHDRTVIKKYAIGEDSILNIFVLPHHPDSVKSPTYASYVTGIALGTSLKMSGQYELKERPWESAPLLNHEVGHILGLAHAWGRHDGCDDTPEHPNCFQITGEPPCDDVISNNLMDYNNSQMAITPCQLGIVHKGFANLHSKTRPLLEPQWCQLDTSHAIVIKDTIQWKGARDLKHDMIIEGTGILEISCRVSMPAGGKIIVKEGGRLFLNDAHLHNACGKTWEGLFVESSNKKSGVVVASRKSLIENVREELKQVNE